MTGASDLATRLVVGLSGPEPTAREWAWLEHWRPAGVILFARNVTGAADLTALCAALHRRLPGIEIVADHEGGPVSALAAAVGRPPPAWSLGLLDDTDLTWRVHRATGERLAACGIDRVLAPVADVLTEPRSPVIGVRAFGADHGLVARHVAAAVAGLMDGGCAVCLKHWPGHGGAATDSHLEDTVVAPGEPVSPFASGLAAGADAVMLGHLDEGSGVPASLDPQQAAAVRALAAPTKMHLYSDDITMGGLRSPMATRGVLVPPGSGLADPGALSRAWVEALAAGGSDRLLVRGIPWVALPLVADVMADPTPPIATLPSPVPDDPAYGEVRRRLAGRVPAGLTADVTTVLWLDRTEHDRWGPAAGDASGLLGPGAHGVAGSADPVGPATGLVVISHRPLDPEAEGTADWKTKIAENGLALGVGHPALETDLKLLLPQGWRVVHVPEWHP